MKVSSIQFKVVSIIIIILLAAISTTLILTISDHKSELIQSTEQTLSVNTGILNSVIRNIMLTGEAPLAKQTMEELKSLPFLDEVDLYRVDGSRAFTDFNTINMVNEFQDSIQFEKTERLENRMKESPLFKSVLETKTPKIWEDRESQTLEYFFPILNYSECRDCHGDTGFVRGVSHFKVSLEGIYKRIRFSTIRSVITLVFIGILIASLLIVLLKKTVLSPISSIGNVVKDVGRGNLERKIELNQNDELGTLGDSINTMIADLKDRNRLLVRNKIVETRNRESKKYLDNIQEGLILLNRKYEITYTYSQYFVDMFENETPEGESIFEIIYPDNNQEKIEELKDFLDMIFNNPLAEMEMILEVNPLKNTHITLKSGKEIIIDAYFARIYNEFDEIENIMVIFKDRTKVIRAEEELKSEKERSETEIEILSTILKNGRESLSQYRVDIASLLNSLANSEVDRDMLRDIHTLKGTSKYFDLNYLAAKLHDMEEEIANNNPYNSTVEQITSYVDNLDIIIKRFDDFLTSPKESSIERFVKSTQDMVMRIGENLDKPIQISFKNEITNPINLYLVQGSLVHLIRNSIDHGIEDRYMRATQGKREIGTIFINLIENQEYYIFEIGDDGGGIIFPEVKKHAIEKGIINSRDDINENELINIIFSHGFSSKESSNELSGRGIGLDAVKDNVNDLGGKISLRTELGVGTMFRLEIPRSAL